VRLYLSSFWLGIHPERLAQLVGRPKARVLAIMNAFDGYPDEKRHALLNRLCGDFMAINFAVEELDLRAYFGRPQEISRALADSDLVWANGGNVFTLRAAMQQSGFDHAIRELLHADALVYGGHSAGAVVAAPTLEGIELVDSADPAEALPTGYAPGLVWAGLGLVPYSIAPHYRSDHFESARIEQVVEYFKVHGMPYRALRDGEAILVNGEVETILAI
jgi:dipeptidase E